jgi:hypothetical protein
MIEMTLFFYAMILKERSLIYIIKTHLSYSIIEIGQKKNCAHFIPEKSLLSDIHHSHSWP